MRRLQGRYEIPIIFWWLYAFLGACCLLAGVYLFYINHLLGKLPYQAIGPIAIILVIFGPIRMANSARMIYTLRKRAVNHPLLARHERSGEGRGEVGASNSSE